MLETSQAISGEAAQEAFGRRMARHCSEGMVIFLQGELGAGKTTLARGFLRGLGYEGKVKSPTYTLVEEYLVGDKSCYHFDLYRLADPEELEYMGIRDFLLDSDILLVEWPDKGAGFLPEADLLVDIRYENQGRNVTLKAKTPKGNHYLKQLHFETL
jgi:tRNA threonylcarbamoyladenosine biosynthesis protein TsaE